MECNTNRGYPQLLLNPVSVGQRGGFEHHEKLSVTANLTPSVLVG